MMAFFSSGFKRYFQKEDRSMWLTIGVIILIQVWFSVIRPIETTWYQPVSLFYLIISGSVLGLGTYIMIWMFFKDSFEGRHKLAWDTVILLTAGYLIYGLGTEYVGFVNKPQAVIEQEGRLIYALAGVMVLLAGLNKRINIARKIVRLNGVLVLVMMTYVVFSPPSMPVLPLFSKTLSVFVYSFTVITWAIAGLLFLRIGKTENKKMDLIIGQTLLMSAAMTGFRYFEVWHPLWFIFHVFGSMAYLSSSVVLTTLIRREPAFQIKRFFMMAMFTAMVPAVMICSYLAGYAALSFGKNLLSDHAVAFGAHMQDMYAVDPASVDAHEGHAMEMATEMDHSGSMTMLPLRSNYSTTTFNTLAEAIVSEEFQTSHVDAGLASTATFDFPIVDVCVDTEHGEIPVYKLISVVPMEASNTGPVTVVVQSFPDMAHQIANIRIITMVVILLAALSVFLLLTRIILIADARITSQEKQLKVAYEEVKRAEKVREDLTDMVVHDLRNPLSGIMSSLSLLKRVQAKHAHPTEQEKRLVVRANVAAENMRDMIADMLNISKMERGQLSLEITSMRVHNLLEERLLAFETTANQDGNVIHQVSDLQNRRLRVNADERLIKRVLDNLITNAIRYTPRGGIITLRAYQLDDMMCLEVSDTGVGIPANKASSIFEKFTQVSEDQGLRRRGLGLGLAFCKLAVEAHGGKIWVESELNRGTAFKFTLPLAKYKTPETGTLAIRDTYKAPQTRKVTLETGPLSL